MEDNNDKYILIGLSASGLLFAFYIVVSSLLGGFAFALENFVKLGYWMIPLIVGFGIQIGLFFYVKEQMHKKATAHAAASTGISSVSMVACCAHHIADIAPFLGIAAMGLFLTKYQTTFLIIGILSNILGIFYMYTMMNTKISKSHLKILFYYLLFLSIIIVTVSFYFASKGNDIEIEPNVNQASFQTLASNENNVEFKVTPISANEFQISMDTHSVNLDFELTGISTLYDNLGNAYQPIKWEGSEPGGHHRSGTLKFPEIKKNAKSIKLIIIDTTKREFEWKVGK